MSRLIAILFLVFPCSVFSQISEWRLSVSGAVGAVESGFAGSRAKKGYVLYGIHSVGLNIARKNGTMIILRYVSGSHSENSIFRQSWRYRGLACLAGVGKESRIMRYFVAGGLGSVYERQLDHQSLPPTRRVSDKVGLAYEAGFMFIPVRFIGIGFRLMGQFSPFPLNGTTSGYAAVLELGHVRNKD